jgi:hypothetical protein
MIDSGLTSRRLAVFCFVLLTLVAIGCGGTSTPSTPPAQSENGVPAITSITPSTVTAGAGDLSISVTGTGFVSGSAVRWNGTAIVTTFSTDTSLAATVPANDLADGLASAITVFNPAPGGGSSVAVNFTVNNPPPELTAVSPASVVAGSSQQTLTVAGTGFVPSSVVDWNGTPLTTSWVSGTELKATPPASAHCRQFRERSHCAQPSARRRREQLDAFRRYKPDAGPSIHISESCSGRPGRDDHADGNWFRDEFSRAVEWVATADCICWRDRPAGCAQRRI